MADVFYTQALRRVFRQGQRLFLLSPPAAPPPIRTLWKARASRPSSRPSDGSGLQKIVAESTYGARPVDRGGDLGILWGMEQALHAQPIPASIIRAAYYMSNLDASLQTAATESVVHSLYPADFQLPMVAPRDIGELARAFPLPDQDRPDIPILRTHESGLTFRAHPEISPWRTPGSAEFIVKTMDGACPAIVARTYVSAPKVQRQWKYAPLPKSPPACWTSLTRRARLSRAVHHFQWRSF